MSIGSRQISGLLLAALPFSAVQPAQAASNTATNAKIEKLESEIQQLTAEVQDLKRSTSSQYADTQSQRTQDTKVTIDNGRPTIASADGRFTASVRGLAQFDAAYYSQDKSARNLPTAFGPDLSSGANFRRVYFGVQGKAFGDWSYNINFDFGGSGGTETPGHVQSVYAQYDGLKPFAFRIGAYPPPANIEDGTSSGDTIFLERNSPSDLQRSIAGGDGRDAASILYTGDKFFGAFSYTGGKAQDGAVFDEQQALLGRASYLIYADPDAHFLIGGNGTYVIKFPDAVANGGAVLGSTPGATALNSVTLSDPPELTVDSNGIRLVNTGALSARHLWQWGVEAAGNWRNFYAQAGYYDFAVERAAQAFKVFTDTSTNPNSSHTEIVTPSDDSFSGWYVQASWILTGESKGYNAATGAFTPPKPAAPLALDGSGFGAWELAARYSTLNLNDHAGDAASVITNWTGAATRTYTYYNTARGGEQKIWTLGLNWYPNNFVRFALDYQWIDIDRLQSPATVTTTGMPVLPHLGASQTVQAISLRSQISI